MKALLKIAILAGAAGALVNLLLKKQRGASFDDWAASRVADDDELEAGTRGSAGASRTFDRDYESLPSDTNLVSGRAENQPPAPQPQDWRGAQNVLDS